MSYDVYLVADLGGPEPIEVADVGNYTSNVSHMWRRALGGNGVSGLHGQQAQDAIEPLRKAIAVMEDDPATYRAVNPTNGWGNYEGALEYLRKLLAACLSAPRATIKVSA